jgi:hypothetical protein
VVTDITIFCSLGSPKASSLNKLTVGAIDFFLQYKLRASGYSCSLGRGDRHLLAFYHHRKQKWAVGSTQGRLPRGAHFVLPPFAHSSVAGKKHFDVPKIPIEKPLF